MSPPFCFPRWGRCCAPCGRPGPPAAAVSNTPFKIGADWGFYTGAGRRGRYLADLCVAFGEQGGVDGGVSHFAVAGIVKVALFAQLIVPLDFPKSYGKLSS